MRHRILFTCYQLTVLVALLSVSCSDDPKGSDGGPPDTGSRKDVALDMIPEAAGPWDASTEGLQQDSGSGCNSTTGLATPLAACSLQRPCENGFVFADGGTVEKTIKTPSDRPSCKTTVAWRGAKFDDGPPSETLDDDGVKRYACIYRPPQTSKSSRRPLLVYLHGSGGSAGNVYDYSRLRVKAVNYDLSGDSERPGFILASVQGRNLHWPTMHGDGSHHDYYYRAGDQNPDVAYLDQLIDGLVVEEIVDPRRIFVMGWSNGATFAQYYALLRHGTATSGGAKVAAAAVFAFANPYSNLSTSQKPSCELNPYPTSTVPMYLLNRACDSLTACSTEQEQSFGLPPGHSAERWVQRLASEVGNPNVTFQIIDGQGRATSKCTSTLVCTKEAGTLNHLLWPDGVMDKGGNDWEPAMLDFLRKNPLP